MAASKPRALNVVDLSKTFGATRALAGVSFAVDAHTVHGLLGENGSGKSTLVKILSGYHMPDPGGRVELWNETLELPLRAGAHRELGMGFVHQSLALTPALSVVENLRLADVTRGSRFAISWRSERAKARQTLASYGVKLEVTQIVAQLTRSEQAKLAIVRALEELRTNAGRLHAGLLVLDEATVAFTEAEKAWLYNVMHEFTSDGGAVIYISHDVDEVIQVTDAVTVLRDGAVRGSAATSDVDRGILADWIVGLEAARTERALRPPQSRRTGDVVATITGLTGGATRDVNMDVSAGEVLGLTGLVGTGFSEVLPLLFGATRAEEGVLTMDGRPRDIRRMTPQAAVRSGIALVPSDREKEGCVLDLSVTDNVTLCSLKAYRSRAGLNRRGMTGASEAAIRRFAIRAGGPAASVRTLSGGNQQRVLLAKWLATNPQLLLLIEPTVGLDISARVAIHRLVRDFASGGKAVICASADWEQLADICNRVIVFAGGQPVSTVAQPLTKEAIGHECYRASEGQVTGLVAPRSADEAQGKERQRG